VQLPFGFGATIVPNQGKRKCLVLWRIAQDALNSCCAERPAKLKSFSRRVNALRGMPNVQQCPSKGEDLLPNLKGI
jgi:hypothetical protein